MKIEEVVGQNLARLRNKWNWSQSDLGEEIGAVQGKPWSRQTVSAAESGARSFTVADLMTLAVVLQVPVETLLLLPDDTTDVLVGERLFRRDELGPMAWQSDSTNSALRQLGEDMNDLFIGLRDLGNLAYDVEQISGRLSTVSSRLTLQQALEAKGVNRSDDDFGLPGTSKANAPRRVKGGGTP